MSPAQATDKLGLLAELGVDEHIVRWHNIGDVDGLELFANEIVPAADELHLVGR